MKPTATKSNRKNGNRMVGAYVESETHDDFAFIAKSEHRTVTDHLRKLVADELASKADLLATRKPKRPTTRK